jgi:hypothetical protein
VQILVLCLRSIHEGTSSLEVDVHHEGLWYIRIYESGPGVTRDVAILVVDHANYADSSIQ